MIATTGPARTYVIEFAADEGTQLLYTEMTAEEANSLAEALTGSGGEDVISMPASLTPGGPSYPRAMRVRRIVSITPYDPAD